MNGELKEFISKHQKEQTKLLSLYNIFDNIEEFGENWFFIGNGEVSFFGKIVHLLIFVILLFTVSGSYAIIKLFVFYIGLHIIIRKTGEYISIIYARKLETVTAECQKKLNDFCQKEIQNNNIIDDGESDEIRFDDGFSIKDGYFEAELKTGCEPIDIYCLQDRTAREKYEDQKLELDDEVELVYADMKKNIASTEFNQRFGVLTLRDKEHECMKVFTPASQLEMVKTQGFDLIREIHIWNEKIHASMICELKRPNIKLDQYEKKAIRKGFDAAENYYKTIVTQADMAHACYLSLKELANN